jgi:hypothetical protein
MLCPFCEHTADKVVDSRESKEGDVIRRRRECLGCGRRFTTYERIDDIPYMVVKKDGRRERFDRQKVLNGLLRACEKRPVSMGALQELVAVAAAMAVGSTVGPLASSRCAASTSSHSARQSAQLARWAASSAVQAARCLATSGIRSERRSQSLIAPAP